MKRLKNRIIIKKCILGLKNIAPIPMGPAAPGAPVAGGSGEGTGQYTRPQNIENQTVSKKTRKE